MLSYFRRKGPKTKKSPKKKSPGPMTRKHVGFTETYKSPVFKTPSGKLETSNGVKVYRFNNSKHIKGYYTEAEIRRLAYP